MSPTPCRTPIRTARGVAGCCLLAIAFGGAAQVRAIEMFTNFGDGSRIGLPSLEVPIKAYPGIPLRSDRLRARALAAEARRAAQAGDAGAAASAAAASANSAAGGGNRGSASTPPGRGSSGRSAGGGITVRPMAPGASAAIGFPPPPPAAVVPPNRTGQGAVRPPSGATLSAPETVPLTLPLTRSRP
ncbi:MAG: hypothetical protein DWH79_11195 [Planctomycetota bacterium]|nr:MAG: hypothetical protein DWH79_11195 [Planctomycetota bacterium]